MSRPGLLRHAGVLACAAALAVGVAACGGDSADLGDGVVAKYGSGQQVTADELQRAVDQQVAQAEQQGQTAPEPGTDAYTTLRRQVLDNIKLQKLVEVEAGKCGKPCAVSDADVTKELRKVRDQNFDGSQKKLDDFLKQAKLTTADARRILKFTLQQPKLVEFHSRGVKFTTADARSYYRTNIAQFRTPAGRTARHILVDTKAKADAISARVTDANFAQIAQKESKDPGSGKEGGELGAIQKGQLVPEFEKVAFSLGDGEISKPVKSQFGWHIIQVQITPARTQPFAEAREGIISSQLTQKKQEAFAKWRDGVLKKWDKGAEFADDDLKPEDPTTVSTATDRPTTTGGGTTGSTTSTP